METINVKFEWDGQLTEENKGHTKDEWGKYRRPYYLVAYKTIWE